MNNNVVEMMVQSWAQKHSASGDKARRDELKATLRRLRFLEKKLFAYYEPSLPPNPGYWQRLTDWLGTFPSEPDQETALNLAGELFFIGEKEIEAMHRAAYLGPIRRWLVDISRLDLMAADLTTKLEMSTRETWFCPITDSMKINTFFHSNNVPSVINHRPDWHSLAKFGDSIRILDYIAKKSIKAIILLEDFIATGSQAIKAIQYAADLRPTNPIPVLVVPLVLCPQAAVNFAAAGLPSHVRIEPVLKLENSHFVSEFPDVSSEYDRFRILAERTYGQVCGGVPASGTTPPYNPLGFGKTGGLVVLGTNTPDNTLPLVHWKSDAWKPLFPRHSRV